MKILYGITILWLIACTGNLNTPKETVKLRFQNMVGLELSHAGCSILNYGGLDRLCEYSTTHPADLIFQVGPALSQVIPGKMDKTDLKGERAVLWNEWKRQGVKFYAVSAEDLSPSLEEFEATTSTGDIVRVSSNLKKKGSSDFLFSPFYRMNVGGLELAFLSFTEVKEENSKAPWQVVNVVSAFKEVTSKLRGLAVYHVTGSLSGATRKQIANLSDKPVLFIGGELSETNTTEIVQESKNSYFVKAPDLGRGLAELEIGTSIDANATKLGGLNYRYRAILLRKERIQNTVCSNLVQEINRLTQPRTCSALSNIACEDKKVPDTF